jgi:hypothetical protein
MWEGAAGLPRVAVAVLCPGCRCSVLAKMVNPENERGVVCALLTHVAVGQGGKRQVSGTQEYYLPGWL